MQLGEPLALAPPPVLCGGLGRERLYRRAWGEAARRCRHGVVVVEIEVDERLSVDRRRGKREERDVVWRQGHGVPAYGGESGRSGVGEGEGGAGPSIPTEDGRAGNGGGGGGVSEHTGEFAGLAHEVSVRP